MATKTDMYYYKNQTEPFGFLLMKIVRFLAMFFPIAKAGIRENWGVCPVHLAQSSVLNSIPINIHQQEELWTKEIVSYDYSK